MVTDRSTMPIGHLLVRTRTKLAPILVLVIVEA